MTFKNWVEGGDERVTSCPNQATSRSRVRLGCLREAQAGMSVKDLCRKQRQSRPTSHP